MKKQNKDENDKSKILDINFFIDDIKLFDKNIDENEKLYEELHNMMNKLSSSSLYSGGKIRDIADIGKTLSSIRATNIEAINKKIMAKKTVADIELKKMQLDNDTDNSDFSRLAREMIKTIYTENVGNTKPFDVAPTYSEANYSEKDIHELDKRVKKELEEGNIKLTKNDKAMKYSLTGVNYKYDVNNDRVLVYDKVTGELIEDYPEERIPFKKKLKEDDKYAYFENGFKLEKI